MISSPASLDKVVFIAHGAGAGQDSEFMKASASIFKELGFEVVAFEFPYMVKAKALGKRHPPNRMPILLDCFKKIVANYPLNGRQYWFAGKSMGGRVATMLADELGAESVFVFGYPFHPQSKPENLRIDHLTDIECTINIFQGTRDKLGALDEVLTYDLSPNVALHWLEDGDHDLVPRKRSGVTFEQHLVTIKNIIKGKI